MSTLNDVLTYSRTQAQTDSNGITDAKGIIFANEALSDFHRKLVKGGIDASSVQEAYRDGSIPSTGNGSTFLYPTDMMFLKAIEVNYQDTTAQNYITALQYDASNVPNQQSFSWLRANGSTQTPLFDDHGDWFEIAPAFQSGNNISQAIRIIYFQKPTAFTAVSDTVAYPESLDITILSWRIVANYYRSLRDFDLAKEADNEYQVKVSDIIATLGRGSQQPLQAVAIQDTGWNY